MSNAPKPLVINLDKYIIWLWIAITAYDLSLWYTTGKVNGYEIAFDVAMIFFCMSNIKIADLREQNEEYEKLEALVLEEDEQTMSPALRDKVRQLKRDRR